MEHKYRAHCCIYHPSVIPLVGYEGDRHASLVDVRVSEAGVQGACRVITRHASQSVNSRLNCVLEHVSESAE